MSEAPRAPGGRWGGPRALPGVCSSGSQPATWWGPGPLRAVAMKSLKSRLWKQDAPGPTSPSSPTAVVSTVSRSLGGDSGDLFCCAPHRRSELLREILRPLLTLAFCGVPYSHPFPGGTPSLSSRGAILLFACPIALRARDTGARWLPSSTRCRRCGLRTHQAPRLSAVPELGETLCVLR